MGKPDWFKCDSCHTVFVETEAGQGHSTECSEAWGQREVRTLYFPICPDCGGENLADYYPCQDCVDAGADQPNEALTGTDSCAACFKAYEPNEFYAYCRRWPEDVPEEYRV